MDSTGAEGEEEAASDRSDSSSASHGSYVLRETALIDEESEGEAEEPEREPILRPPPDYWAQERPVKVPLAATEEEQEPGGPLRLPVQSQPASARSELILEGSALAEAAALLGSRPQREAEDGCPGHQRETLCHKLLAFLMATSEICDYLGELFEPLDEDYVYDG